MKKCLIAIGVLLLLAVGYFSGGWASMLLLMFGAGWVVWRINRRFESNGLSLVTFLEMLKELTNTAKKCNIAIIAGIILITILLTDAVLGTIFLLVLFEIIMDFKSRTYISAAEDV